MADYCKKKLKCFFYNRLNTVPEQTRNETWLQ